MRPAFAHSRKIELSIEIDDTWRAEVGDVLYLKYELIEQQILDKKNFRLVGHW